MTKPGAPARRPSHWSPLQSAQAERDWIDARIAAGVTAPTLALVRYSRPAVVYGRRGGEEPERAARAVHEGFAVLRRRTGGGAVLVGPWMLGFHVLLPVAHPVARLPVIASMVWLGKAVSTALALSRVANALVDPRDIEPLRRKAADASLDWACYAAASHGELLDEDGRKLVGLSQCRGAWGILLSGGLLIGQAPWESLEYVHVGCRPAQSPLRCMASPGIESVAPGVVLPDLYARLATCVEIALDAAPEAGVARQRGSDGCAAGEGVAGLRGGSAPATVRT